MAEPITKTSEFWVGMVTAVLAAVGGVLVKQNIISVDTWKVVEMFIVSGITYVAGRVTSKQVKK